MNPHFAKKLLQLDTKATNPILKSKKIAHLYAHIGYYFLEILNPTQDNGRMLSNQELKNKNQYFMDMNNFKKRLRKISSLQKPKKPQTNEDFAKQLTLEHDADFIFDGDLSALNLIHDIKDYTRQDFFKQFGLSFKLCPAGIVQRKYLSQAIFFLNEYIKIENHEIKKQYTMGSGYNQLANTPNLPTQPEVEGNEEKKEAENLYNKEFQVQISQPFWMLDGEITLGLFEKVMGYHLNFLKQAQQDARKKKNGNNSLLDPYSFLPANNIDWDVAILFCNRLSRILGLQPCYLDYQGNPILSMREYWELAQIGQCPEFYTWGVNETKISADKNHYPREIYKLQNVDPSQIQVHWDQSANGFRLPTTSEWILALNLPYDEPPKNINDLAWHKYNSKGQIQAIKQKLPNRFGLYDMMGNVSELVFDFVFEQVLVDLTPFGQKSFIRFNQKSPLVVRNLDTVRDVVGKLKKDFYVGTPKQVSILEHESFESKYRKDLSFELRIPKRWQFGYFHFDASSVPHHTYTLETTYTGFLNLEVSQIDEPTLLKGSNNQIGFRICQNLN